MVVFLSRREGDGVGAFSHSQEKWPMNFFTFANSSIVTTTHHHPTIMQQLLQWWRQNPWPQVFNKVLMLVAMSIQ